MGPYTDDRHSFEDKDLNVLTGGKVGRTHVCPKWTPFGGALSAAS